jgi:hypothetical protein
MEVKYLSKGTPIALLLRQSCVSAARSELHLELCEHIIHKLSHKLPDCAAFRARGTLNAERMEFMAVTS